MNRRTLLIAAGVLGLVALSFAWLLLPLKAWILTFGEWARGLGPAGLALISAAYVVGTVLAVPGFPMTLAVAVIYGWWALPISFLGGLSAAVISFLAARHFARNLVKRLLDRHPALKAVDSVARDETFKTILLARLTPVTPFALENYAFGLTGVRFGSFMLASAVGIVPGTILTVWVGVIGRTAAQGEASIVSWSLLIVGLAAGVILSVWMTRKAKQKLQSQAK